MVVVSIHDATDRGTQEESVEASESDSGTYTSQRPPIGTPSRHKDNVFARFLHENRTIGQVNL